MLRPTAAAEVDVAVVGGGFVGLSTAYWLARMGRRPVVFEAEGLAGRASGRNAGLLLTGSPAPLARRPPGPARDAALALWHLSRESRELLRRDLLDPNARTPADCGFLPEGSWISAVGDGDVEGGDGFDGAPVAERLAELAESGDLLRDEGFDVEWRDGPAAREASGSPRLAGALFQPRDGGVDPVRLCRELARLGGFEVRTGFRMRELGERGGRIHLASDAGEVLADRVVVALNAYAPTLLPTLAGTIRPVRGQMLATARGERTLSGIWFFDAGFEYARQLADGTLIVGGARQVAKDVEIGYLESPTATVQGALEEFLRDTFPALAGRPVAHRWAGILAFTADGLPRIGEVPHLPGVLYAAGFSGHGMSLGFATGLYLARRTCGEDVGELLPASEPSRPHAVGT